ncbi:hypothetical protein ACHAXN_008232, partial [Cyclotella atomus]
ILPKITSDDILRSSKQRCRVTEDKRVYLDDEVFDLDEQVPLCLEILSAHPHLKDVRFKLVPSRLVEERFWAALFGILNDGVIDIDDVIGEDLDIEDDYQPGDEMEVGGGKSVGSPTPTKAAQSPPQYDEVISRADASNTPPFYLEEIQAQQELISRLQKSLREANQKIRKLGLEVHKERQKRHNEGVINGDGSNKSHSGKHPSMCPRCNSKLGSTQQHTGTWEMHADCKEFLKLDDHLKENLRNEKDKRMNEVLSQMKFILDSDELKDTYGKWSCCGKEEYDAVGCAE